MQAAAQGAAQSLPPSERYLAIRARTQALAAPLSPEDCAVQSMPDASPVKWHLAHVTWFFERFVLLAHVPGTQPYHAGFEYLFNSYYEGVGERHPRPERGLLTRPAFADVLEYRARVDHAMAQFLATPAGGDARVREILELGLAHEEQHQELLLMDVKHLLSRNPLRPAYGPRQDAGQTPPGEAPPLRFVEAPGGLALVGHDGSRFCFDNETPRHARQLVPFKLGSRLVTCGEHLAFMQDGGYQRPELWMSDGWTLAAREGWEAPLYWERRDGEWHVFTLNGLRPLQPAEPVCHVSWYEAEAHARWAGARLPSEDEWESLAAGLVLSGNFAASGIHHPVAAPGSSALEQVFGDAWEWTSSAYSPYPGFRPLPGTVGEYNGKFMVNQFVLRGGSCTTPDGHVRPTYRNFFYPHQRWAFSGFRLAQDA